MTQEGETEALEPAESEVGIVYESAAVFCGDLLARNDYCETVICGSHAGVLNFPGG